MDKTHSNARLRADAGIPTAGVIRINTRHTADFTVIANALAQRPGSAVAIGVMAYILSLPDGAPVSIAALCEHFTEGEIRISRALRQLEDAGYLERRRERGPDGQIRTRTYAYDVPNGKPPTPPTPPRPRKRQRRPAAAPGTGPSSLAAIELVSMPAPGPVPSPAPTAAPAPPPPSTAAATASAASPPAPAPAPALADADPQAVVVLASLRIRDPRLILSQREVAQLAPAVTQWLTLGIGAEQITDRLTVGLPDRFRARPARILAFRLRETPVAVPLPVTPAAGTAVLPWQTCDGGCERAFRAAGPGNCRDCPPAGSTPIAPAATSLREMLRAAG